METDIHIRKAVPADAEKLVELIKEVEDSGLMLFEPGERKTKPEQLEKRLQGMDAHSVIFIAEEGSSLHGYLFVIGDALMRKRHTVYVAIGIREGQRGKGIGAQLFKALELWAREKNLRRIELTVIEHNEAAVALYQKMGYEIEGIKKDSLYIKGEYVNEYYMARILSE
ncbi:GNAT family N-acetyltransferase [Planococcus liqunii]|uniref:GNAT family N-acetyltransferase n=1 Tax=Planococcus liqunii TaxID=3058394 RepID=UPI002607EED9|nr:GNAT family N-acetyltransferase [Planococcus sp. N056]WKA52327.1 GNAT family N-acetyltransferase [Planococcus sp. N056]